MVRPDGDTSVILVLQKALRVSYNLETTSQYRSNL